MTGVEHFSRWRTSWLDTVDANKLEVPKASLDFTKKYDACMIGAGLSGTIFAERFANILESQVLVIDSRPHFGGNCYDYVDNDTGILMNKYGPHLFHTNSAKAWRYITMHKKAPEWKQWNHKVKGWVNDKLIPIPINIDTVNQLFNVSISNKSEMRNWLEGVQVPCTEGGCKDAEQMAKSRIGVELFESIFHKYMKKLWNKEASELDVDVTARIPVRMTLDSQYFSDKYQALPSKGYVAWFASLLSHPKIDVVLNVDYFDHKEHLDHACDKIIYTGRIDRYFENASSEKLEYRSIKFITQKHFNVSHFVQPNSVINYFGDEVPYTRVVEYKHFLDQNSPHTLTVAEVFKDMGPNDYPFYPIPDKKNQEVFDKYRALADATEREKKIYFVGHLANYKYVSMGDTIDNSLDMFYDLAGEPDMPDMSGFFWRRSSDRRRRLNLKPKFASCLARESHCGGGACEQHVVQPHALCKIEELIVWHA